LTHALVVGGGFRGIATAWLLRRAGHAVTLVEAGSGLGGFMRSIAWDGFWLDPGCHVFDNSDDAQTEAMLDLLGEAWHPIAVEYASFLSDRPSHGSAVVRLDDLGAAESARIVEECLAAQGASRGEPRDLEQLFLARYGPRAAAHLCAAARKTFGLEARELGAQVADLGIFGRVGIAPDEQALELKRDPRLDAIVAARPGADRLRFYRAKAGKHDFRNFYPTGAGIGEFGARAARRLIDLGVDVRVSHELRGLEIDGACARLELHDAARACTTSLSGNHVYWALPPEELARRLPDAPELASHVRAVALLLYYFAIPQQDAGELSYVNDFRPGTRVFRASCPGRYGLGNCPPGRSYVCCEVPTERDSAAWHAVEDAAAAVFEEARELGLHRARAPLATKVLRVPGAMRLPAPTYAAARRELEGFLAGQPRLTCDLAPALTKSQIWGSALAAVARHGAPARALAA